MKRRGILHSFLSDIPNDPDALPFLPIAELAGDRRILVENHVGIVCYSTEKIAIKMKYGQLQICGYQLTVQQMTQSKLVIQGRIEHIYIVRSEDK